MATPSDDDASITIREAAADDVPVLLALHRGFCADDAHAFDPAVAEPALAALADGDPLGRIYVLEDHGTPIGYAAVCFGFSLEFGGRDGFLDEIYVRPSHRGRGLGTALLDHATGEARRLGIRALHLEVRRDNEPARRLYVERGFEDRAGYHLMSLRMAADDESGAR